jgi:protein TonB
MRHGIFVVAVLLALLEGCAAPGGDGVPPLRFVQGAMPIYPAAAKAAGLEGWVRVRYAVGADGAVGNPQVVEAAPEGVFDAAARAAVARWRYAPDPRGLGWEGVESVVRFELGERVLP